MFQQRGLSRRRQVVEDIEEDDMTAEVAGGQHITDGEGDVAVRAAGNPLRTGDLPGIEIDTEKRRKKAALAQVEFEESHPAADIEHGQRRIFEQIERRGEDG